VATTPPATPHPHPAQPGPALRTMAIRVEEGLHALLTMMAQLDGTTLTDQMRRAIDEYVERRRSDAGLVEQARAALAAVDQEASTRREAIEGLLGAVGSQTTDQPGRRRAKRPNGGDQAT
jgi:hypothetical protein